MVGYFAAILLVFLAAQRYGEGPEKWMAGTILAMTLSSKAYLSIFGRHAQLMEVDLGLLLIEVIVAAVMVAVALRANRMYTLWMAGFQIIALLAHFARELADQISPIAYVMMYVGPSYLQIITLGLGIWLHYKRVQRHGSYRSWRSSSRRSQAMPPMS